MTKTKADDECKVALNRTHCFCVTAEFQHLIGNHRDMICCWCGVKVCQHATQVQKAGHGPNRTVDVWE